MTVATNDTTARNTISGVGPYAYDFRIFNDTDLTVVALSTDTPPAVVPLTLDTHYTVSGVNAVTGGTVTLLTGAATTYSGYTLDIRSNTPEDQPSNFLNTARFLPESHQDAFDYLSRQIQDLSRRLSRTVRFPDNSLTDGEMAPIQDFLSQYLYISAAGELEGAASIGTTTLTSSLIGTTLDSLKRTAAEISAGVTPTNYAYPPLHLYRYGTNTVPGTTDMTAPFITMMTVAFVNGGTCILPTDLIGLTSVAFTWGTATTTINIFGAGTDATYLEKIGATTTPILDFTGSTTTDGCYSLFQDFSIVGAAKSSHGLRLTNMARLKTRNIKISGCDVGFENVGSLIMAHYDPDWNSNNIGYRSRKSGGIFCNLVNFYGGGIRGNSSFGMDIGDASAVNWYGTDLEQNGTAADANTGNVRIRSTCDDEIGYSVMGMHGGWCEASKGTNIYVEACAGLALSVRDTVMAGNEAGRVMNVGAIQSLVLENIQAGSGGGTPDTVTTAASYCKIHGGVIYALADTVDFYDYAFTSGTGFIQKSTAMKTTNGAAATTTAVAATIFSPVATTRAMYEVFAYLDGAGTNYVANARIGVEGSGVFRMGGENSANLTITVAGAANVQVTQTSGGNQTITYIIRRLA